MLVQEPHTYQGKPQVTCRFHVITGKYAKPPGIEGQALMEPELCGKIGYATLVALNINLLIPGAGV